MIASKRLARWLLQLEIPILLALYLYFILTDTLPLVASVLIFLIYAVRVWLTHRFAARTPFDLPIVLLLVLLPFNLIISPSWSLSLPKIYGIVLGVAFFYAIVNHISTPGDLSLALSLLVLLAFGISIAGLMGTDWAQSKIISASFIYDRLPRFIQGIPRSIAGGFARNGIGGTLTFTIPLLAAVALAGVKANHAPEQDLISNRAREHPSSPSIAPWRMIRPFRYIGVIALALSILTLALTQSRGGILGALIGLGAFVAWKRPRIGLGLVAGGLLILFALGAFGGGSILASAVSDGTLASRLEVWQRGWMMVQDFPLTGIGIGTYNVVAHSLYPFFLAAPDELVPHAHNQFLEIAVDLGIPGLLAYLALLAAFVVCAVRAYRTFNDSVVRALIVGLLCGMIAHHVFGLTDAFILGTKPGLLMWIYFGLVAAVFAHPLLALEGVEGSGSWA